MDIAFNITRKCNLNCPHCFLKKKKEGIKLEKFKEILNSIDVKVVTITGGEPFMRKDIFEILEFLKSKNYKINLLTNGYLLSEDVIKKLVNFNINFYISYDGNNKELLNKMKIAKDYKFSVSSHTILTKKCFKKLEPLLDEISFIDRNFFLYPTEIGNSNLKCIPANEWICMTSKLIKLSKDYAQKIFYEPSFANRDVKNLEEILCPTGKDIFIDSDGLSYPCCLTVDLVKGVKEIRPIKIEVEKCSVCNGGCPALNIEHGHDPRCNKKYIPICPVIVTECSSFDPKYPSHLEH